MKIEIMMDMEAIGEDDTILVQDEFGEYPDSEYVPKSAYDKLHELVRYARNELKKAEDELGRDLMNSATVLLGIRMRELGIEEDE